MDFHLPLLTLLLTALTTTTPLNPRAGGPIGKPIPSNCTQTNPLPHPSNNNNQNHPNGPISGYKPSADFTSTNLLHASYFSPPTSSTPSQLAQQCFEQCYGYGEGTECLSALSGREIPVPEGYYGGKGGELRQACLLYGEFLNPGVFVESAEGTWRGVWGVDISCPGEG